MFWQDDETVPVQDSDAVLDLVFSIQCRQLPVDHAYALSQALLQALPWLVDEPLAAIHLIHVAGSQNGWIRPEHNTETRIHLSHRTKLELRIPRARLQDASQLSGQVLEIAGCPLKVGQAQRRPLSRLGTLFSRHVVCEPQQPEDEFLQQAWRELKANGIRIRKALCGKETALHTPRGPLHTRSLMLAELPSDEAIHLQQQGLGSQRLLGCGVFIPHKGIEAVNKTTDDEAL